MSVILTQTIAMQIRPVPTRIPVLHANAILVITGTVLIVKPKLTNVQLELMIVMTMPFVQIQWKHSLAHVMMALLVMVLFVPMWTNVQLERTIVTTMRLAPIQREDLRAPATMAIPKNHPRG